jgi:hypothetical protein
VPVLGVEQPHDTVNGVDGPPASNRRDGRMVEGAEPSGDGGGPVACLRGEMEQIIW